MTDITSQLKNLFADQLKENEPLANHLNFRIGGPARWMVEAKTGEELQQAVQAALENEVPYFILGAGSNTLASDAGFEGLVIKMANRDITIEGELVSVGAGALSVSVARKVGAQRLTGFEWAVSLPGTIGGAVRGNAGCFGGEMKDVVESARVLRCTGALCEIVELSNQDLQFGYRESILKHESMYVTDVTLKLSKGNPEEIKQKMDEVLAKRKASQPIVPGSAGCAFKNFEYESDDQVEILKRKIKDIPARFLANKKIGCGWVVDKLGLKGHQIGGIKVSDEHGNFLLNTGEATADDVVQMISFIKTRARDELGIQLQEEIQYLGF